jgi:serine/threonine protein kinase
MATSTHSSHTSNAHSSNVVGVHYRVGKKIGEGSFGVIFEGTNLLNNQQVAIKFVPSSNTPFRSNIFFSVVVLTCFWGVGTEKE